MAGSYGTLAALTEVTVKVLPLPEATRTVVLEGLEVGPAVAAMTRALCSSHELGGAAHLPAALAPAGKAMTLARVEGPVPSVEARAAALCRELTDFGAGEILGDAESLALWQGVRDARALALPREPVIWRVAVAPSAAPALLAILGRALDLRYFLDCGGGLVWLAVAGAEDGGAAAIRAALSGGHATLIRAPDALRAAVPVFQPQASAVAALTARVKDSFDPKHILNRGRMYAEL
jgi:glycolate oxidase FAD binding subunit